MSKATEVKVLTEDEIKALAARDMGEVEKLQDQAKTLEIALAENPMFIAFMQMQEKVADKKKEVLKNLEQQMIEAGVKSIVLDEFGTITIVDGKSWKYDENELPRKYFKKAVDTTAINNAFKLTGKLPKGASFTPNQYIKVTPKKKKELKQGE